MQTQVAIIYICGLISSAAIFPAKDLFTARLGRRKTAAIFCLLYLLSCILTAFPRYGVLIIGRCIAGIANTVLFSTLESWCVHEHLENYDFPKEWLSITFSHVAFGSSVTAAVAGFLADIFCQWLGLGPVAPFLLAVPVFSASIACLLVLWNENFSVKKAVSQDAIKRSCNEGLKQILQNVDIFLIGTIQSLFESVLFVFIFVWTPALDVFRDTRIPLGIAFASFMVCFLLGGIVCDYLIAKLGYTMTRLLVIISAASSVVFVAAAYVAWNKGTSMYRIKMLLCLQAFELLCGFYFPVMRVLREKVLPKEHLLSITNWFRVPLTLLSSLALLFLHSASGGTPEIFLFCAFMMLCAFGCSFRFVGRTKGEEENVEV